MLAPSHSIPLERPSRLSCEDEGYKSEAITDAANALPAEQGEAGANESEGAIFSRFSGEQRQTK